MTDPDRGARRRRGAELEDAIFAAVWAELAQTGYAHLTMEGVAARAQTGKQVLYRRWPSRPALVLAAMRHRSGSILDHAPDTGSLREDAAILLRHMVARQGELGIEVMRGLLFEAADLDPAAIVQTQRLWESITERAAKRGEIGTAPVPAHVAVAVADLLRYRMLVSAEQVTGDEIDRLVDDVYLPLVRAHAGAEEAVR